MPAIRLDDSGAINYISTAQNIATNDTNPDYAIVNHTASALRVTVEAQAGTTYGLISSTPGTPAVPDTYSIPTIGNNDSELFVELYRPRSSDDVTSSNFTGFLFNTGTGTLNSTTGRVDFTGTNELNVDVNGTTLNLVTPGTVFRIFDTTTNEAVTPDLVTIAGARDNGSFAWVGANLADGTRLMNTDFATGVNVGTDRRAPGSSSAGSVRRWRLEIRTAVGTPGVPATFNVNPFGTWTSGVPSGNNNVFFLGTTTLLMSPNDENGDDIRTILQMIAVNDVLRFTSDGQTTINATVTSAPTITGAGLVSIGITSRTPNQAPAGNTAYAISIQNRQFTVGGSGGVSTSFTTIVDKRSAFVSGAKPNGHTTVNDRIGRLSGNVSITNIEPLHTNSIDSMDDDDIDNVIYLLSLTNPITFDENGVGSASTAIDTTTVPDFILINNTASAVNTSVEGEAVTVDKRSYIRSGPISNAHTGVNNTMNRVEQGSINLDFARATHTGIIDPNSNNFYFLLAN